MLKEDLLVLVEEMNIKNAEGIIDKINDLVFRWNEYAENSLRRGSINGFN